MNSKTFTQIAGLVVLIFSVATQSMAQTNQPFFIETFASQADFNANWTSGGDNGGGSESWVWLDNPAGFFIGQPDFASETAANGFARFNSDANGNNNHDVTLTINNPIDCSTRDKEFISVQNQYGYFSNSSIAELGVSTDGVNFTYIPILTEVGGNDISDAVLFVEEDISSLAANQPQIFIQFRWRGNFEYLWNIDDIKLFDQDPQLQYDIAIYSPLLPFNFATPVSQIFDVSFGHAYQNNGSQTAVDVVSMVDVSASNGQTFSATEPLNMNLPASAADTVGFSDLLTPQDTGVYSFTYTLSSANDDERAADNVYQGNFLITENLFSKDDGQGLAATQPANIVDNTWEIGNYYVISNPGTEALAAEFSVASNGNVHQGQSVSVLLYQITDNGDTQFDDDDLTVVGFGSYTFTDETGGQLVSAPLLNFQGDTAVLLEEGNEYILTVQYAPDMAVVYTPLPYFYDVATVVKNGSWFLGGFGPDVTALVRMRVRDMNDPTSSQEPALAAQKISLFPNPVSNELTLTLQLDNTSSEVLFEMLDINGRLIQQWRRENTQQTQIQVSTAALAEGTYMMRVRTAEGVRTERFVVQH